MGRFVFVRPAKQQVCEAPSIDNTIQQIAEPTPHSTQVQPANHRNVVKRGPY